MAARGWSPAAFSAAAFSAATSASYSSSHVGSMCSAQHARPPDSQHTEGPLQHKALTCVRARSAFLRARSQLLQKGGSQSPGNELPGTRRCGVASHAGLVTCSLLNRNLRVIFFLPRRRSCRSRVHVGGAERVRRRCCLLLERSICGAQDQGGFIASVPVRRVFPHDLIHLLEERRPRVECPLGGEGWG